MVVWHKKIISPTAYYGHVTQKVKKGLFFFRRDLTLRWPGKSLVITGLCGSVNKPVRKWTRPGTHWVMGSWRDQYSPIRTDQSSSIKYIRPRFILCKRVREKSIVPFLKILPKLFSKIEVKRFLLHTKNCLFCAISWKSISPKSVLERSFF